MAFPEILRQLRLSQRLTQGELAKKAGVTLTAISGWEIGRTAPTLSSIIALSNALDVSADTLLELPARENPTGFNARVSEEEQKIITDYRSLDDYGRQAVSLILGHELERVSAEYGVHSGGGVIVDFKDAAGERFIPKYLTPAAAGVSAQDDEAEFEMLLVDKNVPAGADYAVVIQGNSMEPWIHDGDTVFVKRNGEIKTGDVGIFSYNGGSYCKMYYPWQDGAVTLVSTNPECKNFNVEIAPSGTDSITCQGLVLFKKKPRLPDYFMEDVARRLRG